MFPISFKLLSINFLLCCGVFSLQFFFKILFLFKIKFAIAVIIQGLDVKEEQDFDITYGACLCRSLFIICRKCSRATSALPQCSFQLMDGGKPSDAELIFSRNTRRSCPRKRRNRWYQCCLWWATKTPHQHETWTEILKSFNSSPYFVTRGLGKYFSKSQQVFAKSYNETKKASNH